MHDFCITLKVTHFLCLRGIGYAAVLLVVAVCHLLSQMDPYIYIYILTSQLFGRGYPLVN